MTPDEIIREMAYFSPGVVRLNEGAAEQHISRAETVLGVRFSASFRRSLAAFNGGHLVNEPLLGVPPIHSALDLVKVTVQGRAYWGPMGWSNRFVEVGTDGCGSPYALLLDRHDERGESPVGLFDSGSMQVTEIVASDYLHFVWFLMQDVMWDHDPEGRAIPREAIVWSDHKVIVHPGALCPWRFNEAWMLAHDPGLARWR